MPRSPCAGAVWADENAASSKQGGGWKQCRAADKILKGRCGCSNGLINSRKFPLNPVCWGSERRSVRPRVTHLLQVLSGSESKIGPELRKISSVTAFYPRPTWCEHENASGCVEVEHFHLKIRTTMSRVDKTPQNTLLSASNQTNMHTVVMPSQALNARLSLGATGLDCKTELILLRRKNTGGKIDKWSRNHPVKILSIQRQRLMTI